MCVCMGFYVQFNTSVFFLCKLAMTCVYRKQIVLMSVCLCVHACYQQCGSWICPSELENYMCVVVTCVSALLFRTTKLNIFVHVHAIRLIKLIHHLSDCDDLCFTVASYFECNGCAVQKLEKNVPTNLCSCIFLILWGGGGIWDGAVKLKAIHSKKYNLMEK